MAYIIRTDSVIIDEKLYNSLLNKSAVLDEIGFIIWAMKNESDTEIIKAINNIIETKLKV